VRSVEDHQMYGYARQAYHSKAVCHSKAEYETESVKYLQGEGNLNDIVRRSGRQRRKTPRASQADALIWMDVEENMHGMTCFHNTEAEDLKHESCHDPDREETDDLKQPRTGKGILTNMVDKTIDTSGLVLDEKNLVYVGTSLQKCSQQHTNITRDHLKETEQTKAGQLLSNTVMEKWSPIDTYSECQSTAFKGCIDYTSVNAGEDKVVSIFDKGDTEQLKIEFHKGNDSIFMTQVKQKQRKNASNKDVSNNLTPRRIVGNTSTELNRIHLYSHNLPQTARKAQNSSMVDNTDQQVPESATESVGELELMKKDVHSTLLCDQTRENVASHEASLSRSDLNTVIEMTMNSAVQNGLKLSAPLNMRKSQEAECGNT